MEPGETFEADYPFVRDTYDTFGEDGPEQHKTWRPGVRFDFIPPDDSGAFADGLGAILLTVVSTHKPGRFPSRVFYTRKWRDPTGRVFGKGKLHIATAEKFRRLASGYGHDFTIAEPA